MIENFNKEFYYLSNFYPISYTLESHDDILYKSVEHGFQSEKAINIEDRNRIIEQKTPGLAKRLGKNIKCKPQWDEIKLEIMKKHVLAKFQQNDYIKKKLISTNNIILIEGNTWHDNFWGKCSCVKCISCEKNNNLGKILMEVRDILSKS